MMKNLHVASSLPVAMASPLGWNFTLFISDVWPCDHYHGEYDGNEEDDDHEKERI